MFDTIVCNTKIEEKEEVKERSREKEREQIMDDDEYVMNVF